MIFRFLVQNVTPNIVENFFNLMDKIIFRKKSSIELNKAILYDHNNPKEHSDIENCFIIKYMTY